ncbi:MAG: ABC transporter permease [Micromonosporaceae bacterium]
MKVLRFVAITWWLLLKIRSRSAFDGPLTVVFPVFFATSIFMMFKTSDVAGPALLSAAIGASAMGIWSAVNAGSVYVLQAERGQGTLELMVAAPQPFSLLIVPMTLSMATIGVYSMFATLLWGWFAFGIEIEIADPAAFIVALMVTVLAIAMLGALLAISSIRYREAWALGAAIGGPVLLLCGFIVAVKDLPEWVQPLSWALAPTWGMSAIRAATEGRSPWGYIGACLAIAVAYGIVGELVSRWMLHSARTHATLALN